MREWLEEQVGKLTDAQMQAALDMMKADMACNQGLSARQVEQALSRYRENEYIRCIMPTCARLAISMSA